MEELLRQIRSCRECEKHLMNEVNPVIAASANSKILVIGQAPGRIVHNTSIARKDKSGDKLRTWLVVDKSTFYNSDLFALMPMGFCYPSTGKSGDLPPRCESAPYWHRRLLESMPNIELILLIGQYAHQYYLQQNVKENLTETVRVYKEYLPQYFPLPHPSLRNNIW